jgi:V/A-type H+-transporting ATPase subunit F
MAVLTEPESAAGYRLAGMEVAVASDAEEARSKLAGLIEAEAYGLIAVDEGLLADPGQAVRRQMRGRDFPVLLPAPSLRSAMLEQGGDGKDYLRQLIIATIGYEIKL